MAAGSFGAESAISRNRPIYLRGWNGAFPSLISSNPQRLDTDLAAFFRSGVSSGAPTLSPGVSAVQSQTWIFQRPGGRGSFRKFEPSRSTRAIEPSFVRESIGLSASRDPSGDQQTPTVVPGSKLTGISRRSLPVDVHDEKPGPTKVVHGLDLGVSDVPAVRRDLEDRKRVFLR